LGQFTFNKSRRSLWKRKLLQNSLYKYMYNLLKISNIPYNLICTTKCNDSSFLITIIACDYVNLSLANEYVRLFVCITVVDSIIKMDMVHISLTSIYPSHFYACPKPWLVVFLVWSVSSFKMGDDCSLCWYWGNCWPSLLNIFFS
jgi:hypothetical protein